MTTVVELIQRARERVGTASPEEAAAALDKGEAVLVDVRQSAEWEHGHIEGSVPAPRGLLEFVADPASPRHKAELDPALPTIVICHSGARAALAAATLHDMGWADVAVLEGGISGWTAAGLPLTEHEFAV